MPLTRFAQPTTWTLHGGGIQLRYSVAGPALHFNGPQGIKDFTGDQIRISEVADLGVVVSVTLHLTPDSGSTTLSLFLPLVNLPAAPQMPMAVPVTTEAITAAHHTSIIGPFQRGQQEFFTATRLTGTAA